MFRSLIKEKLKKYIEGKINSLFILAIENNWTSSPQELIDSIWKKQPSTLKDVRLIENKLV